MTRWLCVLTLTACASTSATATPQHGATTPVTNATRSNAGAAAVTSQQPGPQHAPTVQWQLATNAPITATATELNDGSVVVGSRDGVLRRVRSDGTLIYALTTDAAILGRALAVDGDHVIVGNEAGAVLRVDASGDVVWRLQVAGPIAVDLVRGADGVIYVASDGIYAIDARGFLHWHHVEATTIYSTPLITPEGLIVFGTIDGRAVAIDVHGAAQWTTRVNAAVTTAIERLPDGSLEIHAGDQALALDDNGALLTATPLTANPRNDPHHAHAAVDVLGTRYFTAGDLLQATRDDGTALWSYNLGARVTAHVMLSSSGQLIVGAEDGKLYALH